MHGTGHLATPLGKISFVVTNRVKQHNGTFDACRLEGVWLDLSDIVNTTISTD
jgi:hypothetical protein